ncbi:MAG TPA: BTAD domain-containing putative transcriptional regulator, partial [Caldilineaceae bacterium]|nr:BTAD domain-containing putative transcriptional regulator [Caldilineaceae bacterium]
MDIAPVLPHLSLSLLGPLRVTLNGESVTTFDSAKVRALLVYLAAEADRPRPRDVLAGLLWPDFPQRTALANLRYALSNLRKAIGDRDAQPPFLLITTDALQFNRASVHTLDLHDFSESVAAGTVERWQQAAALYRGPFLEGFAVGDSAAFEEWLVLKREQLGRQMISALRRLADHFEVRGEYEYAQQYTWRLLELEPWQEEGHQQLMRLLALGGQRGAALAQYESCRRLLADELGVEPSVETTALYERIRGGLLSAWTGHPTLPVFLSPQTPLVESERPLFVARQPELDRLDQLLTRARAGHGRVAFISGEPGSGKTMLLQEFTRRALVAHPDLIAISGYCNAYTGIGDPYLPFLEMLEMLTGDVEAQWTGGGITGEHAQRLWALLPETLSALMRDGPGLIDRFVAGGGLLARAQIGAPVQADPLNELLKRRAASTGAANLQQTDLFAQYTKVLHALARKRPLLLTIDDLQWADIGSVSLLFHLGRRLAGERILLLCAYRSSDLAAGRAGERHPVEPVVNELQRIYGDEPLDLAQADGHCFVETLLDAEPNRLAASFRATLHRHTSGHPLFTVELLRGLQARGDLMKDEAGCWTEAASIQWEKLPPRLEAVIAERIGRLSALLQTTLTVASVEGADFTLEAVARAQAVDAGEILRRLSGPLGKEHQLVAASGGRQLAEGYLSTYRFRHFLFQKYLYNRLDEVERRHWHQALGNALEALHGRQANEIAAQLARHFESARLPTRAVGYLLAAGHKAAQLSAHAEAIAHSRRGLELLPALPDSPERAQQELALQMSLGVSLAESRGYADPEMGRAYGRAWELCRQLGTTPELFPVLTGLGGFYSLRAENQTARLVYEEILAVAQRT